MIKIIAILDSVVGVGGGFDQSLNAILQMQRLSSDRFILEVFTTHEKNLDFLKRLNISAQVIKVTLFDRFLTKYSTNSSWQYFFERFKLIGPLEKNLIKHGCDAAYFLSPNDLSIALKKVNHISTLWDLCHRDHPEFPEVRNFNEAFIRERKYKYTLRSAILILTDSAQLADSASKYFGIERKRFIAMPFGPSPFLGDTQLIKDLDILKKYNLNSQYFFYPAQFWAHKNHIRILQALLKLRDLYSWEPNIVFSGKDYGNLPHINNFIRDNKLESQVKVLGFVPSEDMRGLYENAMAVVMPTYFGPTNLPPIEAWTLGVPVIYSKHLSEQAGNAALLVDPDCQLDVALAMLQCNKLEIRNQLVRAGYRRIIYLDNLRKVAENELCASIKSYAARRLCWD